jgi:hypothetical protein
MVDLIAIWNPTVRVLVDHAMYVERLPAQSNMTVAFGALGALPD